MLILNPLRDSMGFGWAFARFPYGDKWRKHRRFLHAHVNSGVVSNYQDAQLESARTFVDDLLAAEHDNDVLPGMVRAYFGRTIVKMTYGIDVQSGEDEYISVPEQVLSAVNEASVPGRFLVDLFPMRECFIPKR
jgi:cytochrome P450